MRKVALAGNPNCGKTTMFNALTGSNQYVGNWPGVTVEKKEGILKADKNITMIDLPGIYSLSPYSLDEVVARDYLMTESPDVIVNIVDVTNLERNLYLTTQLVETGIPVIVALNMMDLLKEDRGNINVSKLSKALGCTIIEVSALKNEGLGTLTDSVKTMLAKGLTHEQVEIYEGDVKTSIDQVKALLKGKYSDSKLPWYALHYLENDEKVMENSALTSEETSNLNAIREKLETVADDDSESIIANARYEFIEEVVKTCYKKKRGILTTSDKIDKIVTNRILALPIFVLVMVLVYYVSVSTLGTIVTDFTNDVLFGEWIQPAVDTFLSNVGAAAWVNSLVVDGIIGGLAAPIGFAPQMAILFFFLSILEDCGYMARVAFIMDRVFRRFGLSGKSFIPLMISSGCGVPAIMATKTIENEKDRFMTIMTTTFIPCGAKLPVIALIAGAIMGGAWWMAPLMYFIGIAAVIISGIILKKTRMFPGDPAPFVMELPQYHLPSPKGVLMHVWERVWSFLKKAGTILFLCCVVMWFLGSFGFDNGQFGLVGEEESLLASIGNFIAPIFAPLGFDTWQAVASSLSGFVAKEGIVSTMGVVVGLGNAGEADPNLWNAVMGMFPSAAAAVSFLLFNMLDSPCLAAISTAAKEFNSRKWTWISIAYQCGFAYCVALMVYQFAIYFTTGAFGFWTVVAIIILVATLYLLFRKDPAKKVSKDVKLAAANS